MLLPRRTLGTLLALVVMAAAVLPCTLFPSGALGDADATMRAKCPCSCSDGPKPANAVTHLDVGLLPSAQTESTPPLIVSATRTHPRVPHAPFSARDRIPI